MGINSFVTSRWVFQKLSLCDAPDFCSCGYFKGNTLSPAQHLPNCNAAEVAETVVSTRRFCRALAQQLQEIGARLALADLKKKGLDETVTTLPSSDGVTTYELDVSKREAYQKFVRQVVGNHDEADMVINNAGITHLRSVKDGSYEDYERTMDVNFWGVLYCCKEFRPHLGNRPEA